MGINNLEINNRNRCCCVAIGIGMGIMSLKNVAIGIMSWKFEKFNCTEYHYIKKNKV